MLKIGDVFRRLTILELMPNDSALCKCDCGNIKRINRQNITQGRTVSCGCRWNETKNKSKGYITGTKTYHTWENMHNRCRIKNVHHRLSYTGISVCPEWSGTNGYANFFADMGERPEGKSIDRIDNILGYFKSNCKWSTNIEQQNNRKISIRITWGWDEISLPEYARRHGISYTTAWNYIKRCGDIKGINLGVNFVEDFDDA